MNRRQIAQELMAAARELMSNGKTFKCPNCGTKVLEQTGYCLKCKKKVKKAVVRRAADVYETLLKYIQKGVPVLTAQDIHPDIPTIHNFAGRYRNTVDHVGFGLMQGETDHGQFSFDAGGAMNRDDGVSWTTLSADKPVLRDLKYDMNKVKRALQDLMMTKEASVRTAAKTFDDLPPSEQRIAERMMEKGYNYAIQITTVDGDFGEPLYFKNSSEVGPFLRSFPDYKNAKTKWVVKLS